MKEITDAEKERQQRMENRPPLEECLNLHDFEVSTLCESCWIPEGFASICRLSLRPSYQRRPGRIILLPRTTKLLTGRTAVHIKGGKSLLWDVLLVLLVSPQYTWCYQDLVPTSCYARCYPCRLVDYYSRSKVFHASVHNSHCPREAWSQGW